MKSFVCSAELRHSPFMTIDKHGEPVHVPIPDTTLEYVMNASWRVIRNKADSSYYFLAGERWLTAAKLDGMWSPVTRLPEGMEARGGERREVSGGGGRRR
jgi:hypothetical protein